MLDAKTISATLLMGLLGCSSSAAQTQNPEADASAAASSTVDMTPPEATAEPSAAAGSSEVSAAPIAALPMGRSEPLPPMDKKPIASKDQSKRSGADSCCGQGTCGPCAPLPAKRSAPKPPKDGKLMPASQSKRAGKEACCGEGSCGPC
jgi:hypothetical protein